MYFQVKRNGKTIFNLNEIKKLEKSLRIQKVEFFILVKRKANDELGGFIHLLHYFNEQDCFSVSCYKHIY